MSARDDYTANIQAIGAVIDRYRNALEHIAGMGVSQPITSDIPDTEWYRRLFARCQRIARNALDGKDDLE